MECERLSRFGVSRQFVHAIYNKPILGLDHYYIISQVTGASVHFNDMTLSHMSHITSPMGLTSYMPCCLWQVL